MSRDALVALIVIVVAIVWGIVALVDLILNDYRGLTIATPVMLLVVGATLGIRRNGNGAKH